MYMPSITKRMLEPGRYGYGLHVSQLGQVYSCEDPLGRHNNAPDQVVGVTEKGRLIMPDSMNDQPNDPLLLPSNVTWMSIRDASGKYMAADPLIQNSTLPLVGVKAEDHMEWYYWSEFNALHDEKLYELGLVAVPAWSVMPYPDIDWPLMKKKAYIINGDSSFSTKINRLAELITEPNCSCRFAYCDCDVCAYESDEDDEQGLCYQDQMTKDFTVLVNDGVDLEGHCSFDEFLYEGLKETAPALFNKWLAARHVFEENWADVERATEEDECSSSYWRLLSPWQGRFGRLSLEPQNQ